MSRRRPNHGDRRRRLRREPEQTGLRTPIIDAAIFSVARYQHACHLAGEPAHGAADVARFAIRHHPLKPEAINLVVDECRRQRRPIPGETR